MASTGRLLALVLALLLLLYPALVYFGVQQLGPKLLALLLIALAVVRFIAQRLAHQPLGNGAWLLLAAALAGGVTLITGSLAGLKAYPVVVNVVLLGVFGFSLWRAPTVIERLARLRTPDLPVQAVAYTRKVTWVWCGFFMVNGAIAAATIVASEELWALYNGFIAYIAMGVLMGVEYLVRLTVQRRYAGQTPSQPVDIPTQFVKKESRDTSFIHHD